MYSAEAYPAAAEDATKVLEITQDMGGWFRELTATGNRQPIMTAEEGEEKWGLNYGTPVAKVVLPGRSTMTPPEDSDAAQRHRQQSEALDLSARTMVIFDARKGKHAPPVLLLPVSGP
jgi:hypothetical protein